MSRTLFIFLTTATQTKSLRSHLSLDLPCIPNLSTSFFDIDDMEPNADSTAFTVIPSDSEPDMAYGFTQATEELIMAVKYFKMGAQLQSRSVPDEHDNDSVRDLSRTFHILSHSCMEL